MTKLSMCVAPLASNEALPKAFAEHPSAGERAEREAAPQFKASPARRLIRAIDRELRRIEGIREFCDRSDCLLRISFGRVGADMRLGDGAVLPRGAEVLDLHLWNEHLANLGSLTLARTSALRRQLSASLSLLAARIESDPALASIAALRARTAFVPYAQTQKIRHIAEVYGFDMVEYGGRGSMWWRVHDFLENFLICALAWAYNPSALRGKGLLRPRCQFWISREAFLKRYGRLRGVPRHSVPGQQRGPVRGDPRDHVGKQRIGDENAVRWYGFAGGAAIRYGAVPGLEPARFASVVEGVAQPRKP